LLAALARGDAPEAAGEEGDAEESAVLPQPGSEREDAGAIVGHAGVGSGPGRAAERDGREAVGSLVERVDRTGGGATGGDERAAEGIGARSRWSGRRLCLGGRDVDEAQDGLGGGGRSRGIAAALGGEPREHRQRFAGRVEVLGPGDERGVELIRGETVELARVETLEELVLEPEAGAIPGSRQGELAAVAVLEEVPLRDVEEDALHVGLRRGRKMVSDAATRGRTPPWVNNGQRRASPALTARASSEWSWVISCCASAMVCRARGPAPRATSVSLFCCALKSSSAWAASAM
jgi:hypothetical protein